LLKKKLDKNVKLPIKRPGKIKIEIKEGKELELPIKKLDKNLVFLVYGWGRKRRMKRQLKLKYTYKKMSWKFLKFLIKFQDKNLVFPIEILERNLELLKEGKFLDLPIKRKTLIFQTGKREELIISRKDKNLVFLFKRKYKDSKFAVKRGTNDKIQEFPFNGNFLKFLIKFQDKDFVFPMENLERNIKFLINSLEQECSCRIVNMFRSIVFTRLQKSRYFDKL